jgi:flagellar basal-body rod modification protein FlgD
MNWVDISNNQSTSNSIYQNVPSQQEKTTLGKDDFLKILTTQLENQDPTSPLDNKDFIAQMAQFSTLEQMTNLSQSLDSFIKSQSNSQMSGFSAVIGKDITWEDPATQVQSTGVVSGVSLSGGNYYYLIGDQKVPVEQVTDIKQA